VQAIDLDTGEAIAGDQLAQNETGVCTLMLDRDVGVDRYADAKDTGSFILIDPESYATIGMGCIEETRLEAPGLRSRVASWIPHWVPFRENAASAVEEWTSTHARSLAKAVIWRVAASVITFALVYWITDSGRLAASVTAAEIMIKILIYYCHERMWMTIHWGKR
jgi:sulfate adenylyltransferase subunit 1 (EFTu-like GTPase family)